MRRAHRLIGRSWLASADKDNRRRLGDPSDFVRIEIEAALERNVPVIPVLVEGAAMPLADDLPASLKKFARRQAIEISHNRFDSDAGRLIDALAQIDGGEPGRASGSPGPSPPPQHATRARWLIPVVALIALAVGAGVLYTKDGERRTSLRVRGSRRNRPPKFSRRLRLPRRRQP